MRIDFPAWFASLPGFDRRKASTPIHPVHDSRYRMLVEAADVLYGRSGGSPGGHTPETHWFAFHITKEINVAPVPGTPDPLAMAELGAINVPEARTLDDIHFHLINDAGTGQFVFEVYRFRYLGPPAADPGNFTLIATCTVAAGAGDFSRQSFVFVSEALKELQAGDYIFLQATEKMGGAVNDTVGGIDAHFQPRTREGGIVPVTESSYSVAPTDAYVLVNATADAPATVQLPDGDLHATKVVTVIDKKRDAAGATPITVLPDGAQTIMGGASYLMDTSNGMSITLVYSQGDWSIA